MLGVAEGGVDDGERRAIGEAVISEGIRLMHSSWRQTVLAIASAAAQRLLAAPRRAGARAGHVSQMMAARRAARRSQVVGNDQARRRCGRARRPHLVVLEHAAVEVGRGRWRAALLVGLRGAEPLALHAPVAAPLVPLVTHPSRGARPRRDLRRLRAMPRPVTAIGRMSRGRSSSRE